MCPFRPRIASSSLCVSAATISGVASLEQRRRKIALKPDVRRQQPARLGQRKLPVNAQHARAGGNQIVPVAVRAERKNDDGNSARSSREMISRIQRPDAS